ncbi:hypothetical protein RRG08_051119 [Elysia crispata]|uniref:Uncharacterized protein n=1 Tax=Elysia crispata TaxID=231223 RepID=A0AAE1AI24_9GAST|nr:hypothetical protein RRG08_051119 [Elysia crispata]
MVIRQFTYRCVHQSGLANHTKIERLLKIKRRQLDQIKLIQLQSWLLVRNKQNLCAPRMFGWTRARPHAALARSRSFTLVTEIYLFEVYASS